MASEQHRRLRTSALALVACGLAAGGGAGCRAEAPAFQAGRPGEVCYLVPTPQPLVALTFDDGPNGDATAQILDALKAREARATFFLVGTNAEHYPELTRRIAAEGHLIGNHSYSHPEFDRIAAPALSEQIAAGARAIRNVSGCAPRWFRPPYGVNGSNLEAVCRAQGLAIAGWSADAGDWNPHTAEEIADGIVSQTAPGEIVLLHDGWETHHDADRQSTVRAVPVILDRLQQAGYRLVTLDELARQAGPPPAAFANGVTLLGYRYQALSARPGDMLRVRYFWEAPAGWRPDAVWAFVHFVGPDGFRFQNDHDIPSPGDVRDRVVKGELAIPEDAPPGRYALRIGLYERARPDPRHRVDACSPFPCRKGMVRPPVFLEVRPAETSALAAVVGLGEGR